MDENLAWKSVLAAAIFSLIVMAVVYLIISPRESPFFQEEKTEKIAEFKNTWVTGRKGGQKLWEFFAEEGWASRNQEINNLIRVRDGKIYQDGQLVVAALTAPHARSFRRSNNIEVSGPLTARLDLKKLSTRQAAVSEWARLRAAELRYIPNQKRTELTGDVVLQKKDSTINAQRINIDHESRVAEISDRIKLTRPDGALRSLGMRYHGPDERIEAFGQVTLDITEAKLRTRLKSDQAVFYADMDREMTLAGSLEAVQGKKVAVSESGRYSLPARRLDLGGGVRAVFEKAAAAIGEDSAAKLRNREAQKILKEKTFLTSDRLTIFTNTGNARADGQVFVYQQEREARADQAVYDEKSELLTLKGNVFMKKEGEWISAREVIVSIDRETFDAIGSVEAQFKL